MSVLTAPSVLPDSAAPLWGPDRFTTARPDEYCTRLDLSQIVEVRDALKRACAAGLPSDGSLSMSAAREIFALPTVGKYLISAATQVAGGRGFAVISGLPVSSLRPSDAEVLFRGLCAYLGPLVPFDGLGSRVHGQRHDPVSTPGAPTEHNTDCNNWPAPGTDRPHFSTTGADIAGTLCRYTAAFGGMIRLAASATVHNVMLEQAPSTVARLYEPLPFVQYGDLAAGCPRPVLSPVFSLHQGLFSARYSRHQLLRGQQVTGEPLTQDVLEAFELLDTAARQCSFSFTLRAGDLLIVNSHTVLQSRRPGKAHPQFVDDIALLHGWMTLPDYAGRRPRAVDEALRGGWVSGDTLEQLKK